MTLTIPTSELAVMARRHEHNGGCHTALGNGPQADCPLCTNHVAALQISGAERDALTTLERLDHTEEDLLTAQDDWAYDEILAREA